MSDLPTGWDFTTLGKLLRAIEAGQNVKCEERPPIEDEAGLVKISAVTWGRFNEEASKTLPKNVPVSERNRICSGDLLISRANTIELVGASVIVGPIKKRLYLSDKVLRLVVDEPAKRWINFALKTPRLRQAIQAASTGNQMSMRNIPQEKLRSLIIPLAPEAEQTRIADQLDTLLARVNACNDHLDVIPGILKRFRQAVLATALAGALPDADGDQAVDTKPRTTKLSEIAVVGTGSTPLRSNDSFYANSGTPWVTSAATGKPLVTEAEQFVTKAAIAAHRLKTYPEGTLLVAMYGEGKTRGQVSELAIKATINQACAAIWVDEDKASKKFVKLALTANYLAMRQLAEGGNQPNLNLTKIKDFEIPLPSLAEQDAIVRRAEALFSLVDRIEASHKKACARAKRLASQTLAKAFRGELVEQDPQDEPASVLLQRLAVNKPAKASVSRGRPRSQSEAHLSAHDVQPADWVNLPNDAWAAPVDRDGQADAVWLTAVLRAGREPMPERTARLATLLCQQPHLFTIALSEKQAKLWSRLVGGEAKPLPGNVTRFQPATNNRWGRAIKDMRVRGDLIEVGASDEVTWTLGPGAASIDTAGWPDGRASFVVAYLRAHGVESILPSLEPAVLDFVNVRAA
ncbi:restriction endonuclease subunit S [Pigmentiphaga aceris]|nr:restriction endonuclease subunit S [Pigmentiphaga aceris]